MPAPTQYLSSILRSFSTFAKRQSVSDEVQLTAEASLAEFLEHLQAQTEWNNFSVDDATELEAFTQDEQLPPAAQKLLIQFVHQFPPHQTNVFLHQYLLALQAEGCSESTIRNYRSDIRQFVDFAKENQLKKIFEKPKLAEFIQFQLEKGLKESSITRKLSSITQFGLWAVQEGILQGKTNKQGVSQYDWLNQTDLQAFLEETETEQTHPENKPQQTPIVRTTFTPGTKPLSDETQKDSPLDNQVQRFKLKKHLRQMSQNVRQAVNTALPVQTRRWLLPYLNLALIVLFFIGLGYFGYRQLFADTPNPLAYPSTPTRPERILSFQGRLTDQGQNPITTSTAMRFYLYDANTGGSQLWDSTTCSITPDQDGIFTVNLGDGTCGAEIDESVFTENSNIWLEAEIEAETLAPRQPIRTVAYAVNAETVQGYPIDASGSATVNTLLTMNDVGDVVLGEVSPKIRSVSGEFTLEGESLLLQTAAGSDGDIVFDPDGLGGVVSRAYLEAPGATLSATYAGGVPLTVKGGPSGTGNLTEWQTSDGTVKTVVDAAGNLGIGTTPSFKLDVAGDINVTGELNVSGAPGSAGQVLTSGGDGAPVAWTALSNLSVGNADTLDNLDSLQFLRSDTSDNYTSGILTFDSGTTLSLASGSILNANVGSTVDINGNLSIADTDIALDGASTNLTATGNFSVNTDDLFINKANGYVGIGTTSPAGTLSLIRNNYTSGIRVENNGFTTNAFDVTNGGVVNSAWRYDGKFQAASGSQLSPSFSFYSDFDTGIWNQSTDTLGFSTGGTIKMTLSSAGNVGIGTTSPTAKLHVSGATTGKALAIFDETGDQDILTASASGATRFRVATDGYVYSQRYADLANASYFLDPAASGDSLIINGNAGIGTTTPSYKLDVAGTGRFTGAVDLDSDLELNSTLTDINNEVGTAGQILSSTATGVDWIDATSLDNYVDSVTFSTTTGDLTVGRTGSLIDIVTNLDGRYLTSYTETDPIWVAAEPNYFNLSQNEIVTGIPAFNGGITGTSAPFTVDSTFLVTNLNADLLDGYHANNLPYLPATTDDWVNETGDTMTGSLNFSGVTSDITTATNEHLALMPAGTGNVGIGTSSPAYKLDINGSANLTGEFNINSNPGSAGEVLTSNGSGSAPAWASVSSLSVGNADTLDNLDSTQFLRSDTSDNYTSGTLAFDLGTTLDVNGDLTIADTDIALDGASTNLTTTGDFSVNTDDLFVQKSTGNVGIGTITPGTYRLNVNGTGYVSGALSLGTQATTTSHAVRADRSLTAGNGLTGGGDLTANRSFAVDQAYNFAWTGTQTWSNTATFNGSLVANGALSANGDVDLGNAITDSITFTGRVDSNILPITDNTYDLGSSSLAWANIYGANVYADAIYQNGQQVCDASGNCGASSAWELTGEQLHPKNALFHDVLVGGTSTSSATIALQANTGNAYISGNVGIGTTTPGTYKLNVNGTSYFGNDLTINGSNDLYFGSVGLGDVGSSNITAGASRVGVYHPELGYSTSTNVQDVLDDLDSAIGTLSSGGYTGWTARDTDDDGVTLANSEILKFAEGAGIDVNFTTTASSPYTMTVTNTAPWTDTSNSYIQNQTAVNQTADFKISGTGYVGGALSLGTQATTTSHAVRADRSLTAGNGLTGGGDLTANRTFNIGAGNGISVAADSVAINQAYNFAWTGAQTWSNTATFNGNLVANGLLSANGDVDLGNAITDSITFTGRVDSSILPITDNLYDLGSSSLAWANIYGTNVYADAIYQNGQQVCDASGNCGSGLPSGTSGQTIRHNGTDWVADSNLYNDGTNIGIGTTTLGAKLHVVSSIGAQLRLAFDSDTYHDMTVDSTGLLTWTPTGNGAVALQGDAGGQALFQVDQLGSGDIFTASASGQTKVVIDNAGQVGIGTATPQALLDIAGVSSTISNTSGDITLDAASNEIAFSGDSLVNILNIEASGQIKPGSYTVNPIAVGDGSIIYRSDLNQLYYYDGTAWSSVGAGSIWANTDNAIHPADSLASIADLLIGGSSTGSAKFRVSGTTGYTYAPRFVDLNGSSYFLDPAATGTSLAVNGSVGIGTTSPHGLLEATTTSGDAEVTISTTDQYQHAKLNLAGGSGSDYSSIRWYQGDPHNSGLQTWAFGNFGSASVMTFKEFISASDYDVLSMTSSGRVGIMTTSPTEALDVNGDVHISGTGSSIGGADIANAFLLIGSDGAGLGLDSNEIFSEGANLNIGVVGDNKINFQVNSQTKMAIDSTGVGIGLSSPDAKLDVLGDTGIQIEAVTNGGYTGTLKMVDTISQSTGARDDVYLGSQGGFLFNADDNNNSISGSIALGVYDNGSHLFSVSESGVGSFSNSTGSILLIPNGSAGIELREPDNSGTPYIDFSNDSSIDYDVRLYLTGNDTLTLTGGSHDIAEYSPSDGTVHVGDIVVATPTSSFSTTRSSLPYQQSLLGIYSENPGFVFGDNTLPHAIRLALAGRVKTKVTAQNGSIQVGDPITSSSFPGVGMKATQSGYVVGTALESYDPDNSQSIGSILVFVNPGWWELASNHITPDTITTSKVAAETIEVNQAKLTQLKADNIQTNTLTIGGISIDTLIRQIATQVFSTSSQTGQALYSNIQSLIAQTIETQQIWTQQLNTTHLQTEDLATNTITPASGSSDLNLQLGPDTISSESGDVEYAQLNISDSTGKRVAQIDSQGNATLLGNLNASDVTADSINVDQITATSSRMEQLEAKMAEFEAVRAQTAEFVNATVSGTLYATQIEGLDEQLAASLNQPSLLDKLLSRKDEASSSASIASVFSLVNNSPIPATDSAALANDAATLINSDLALTAAAAYINEYFAVNGSAYIGQHLGVGNTILIANSMVIGDNYIEYQPRNSGDEEVALNEPQIFSIQPSGQGTLNLLAGLMILSDDGNVLIDGNLAIAGNVEVGDTLLTDLVQPRQFSEPLQIKLATRSGQVAGITQESRLEITDQDGSPTATISATGQGSFSGLNIDSEDLTDVSTQSATIESNTSSGKATLRHNTLSITIRNSGITNRSLIYISPIGSTQNQVLYVKTQIAEDPSTITNEGQFTVGFDQAINKDVPFNWWIVN